jgi:hypothetical protein
VSDPVAVDTRLTALDPALTEKLLLEANQRGFEARVDTTLAHAPTAAGTLHWHAFVPALRLALKEQGWSIKDHKNCPLIISADKSVAIVVMTGNVETGKEFGNPTNQADKGAVLDEAVQRNHQYQLFENAALSELQKGGGGTQLWVLLYHVEGGAKGVKEIRTELSLPSSFKKKKIVGWAERIILRPISTDKAHDFVPELPAETIDVIVERKSGT